MRKIFFIEPKAPNLHIYTQFPLPRLGSFILATMMRNKGWDVEIILEEMRSIDYEKLKKADLVGISTITATAPRAYAIADRIRGMKIPVIMGGPHVTYLPDEALDHADFIIRGEGERPLMAFIDRFEDKNHYDDVPSLSYWKRGIKTHNPKGPVFQDLDLLPIPDFSLLYNNVIRVAGHRTIPIQTSRGCPFDCTFCSVTGMFGRKYRYRSTENILKELRQYNHRKNVIFFYDDNFTANRSRVKELLQAMIDERFLFKWSTQVRADIAKDENLVRMMKKAGCEMLYIGFESVNPESLKNMKKQQTLEEMVQAIRVIQKHRIHIHGMFVYGFDEDDWKTVKATVRFAKKTRLTSTQFLILTPLPGSRFYETISREDRIQFKDWTLYDAHHVVFKPKRLSLLDLQKAQIFSHQKFYSWIESIKRIFTGKWLDVGLAHYARHLNRLWKKRNQPFLQAVKLLNHVKRAKISVDYQENVTL